MRIFALTCALLAPLTSAAEEAHQLIADFTERENMFARAYKDKDIKQLEQILAPEYALVVSARPSSPMSRADWLALIPKYNVQHFEIRDVQVRCLRKAAGKCVLAAVSSVNKQRADVGGHDRSGEFFIVDIWSHHGGAWKVSARYSGRTEGTVPTLMETKP